METHLTGSLPVVRVDGRHSIWERIVVLYRPTESNLATNQARTDIQHLPGIQLSAHFILSPASSEPSLKTTEFQSPTTLRVVDFETSEATGLAGALGHSKNIQWEDNKKALHRCADTTPRFSA